MKNILRLMMAAAVLFSFAACSSPAGGDPGPVTPPTGVSGNLTGTVIWSADTYVSGPTYVTNTATLIINPGVTVTFASGASLVVEGGASLLAEGTSAADGGIVFKNAASAVWNGIYLDDNSTANILSYCEITGVGSGDYAIRMDPGSIADIQYCVIHGNGGGGIDAVNCAVGTVIRYNRFFANTIYGLAASENSGIDSTNHFAAATDTDGPDLADPYNSVRFSGDITIVDYVMGITEVPYRFDDDWAVKDGGSLNVWAGVKLLFGSGASLLVEGGAVLDAEGDSAHPVVFKGVSSSTRWNGIWFDDNSVQNVLRYCSISEVFDYYAVTLDPSAEATIRNCSIGGNYSGGLDAMQAGRLDLQDCVFGDNGDAAQPPYDLRYEVSPSVTDVNNIYSSLEDYDPEA